MEGQGGRFDAIVTGVHLSPFTLSPTRYISERERDRERERERESERERRNDEASFVVFRLSSVP